MHETQYDIELLKLPKTERTKKLQDQRANSVADLAASLEMQLEQLGKKNMRTSTEEIVIKWQDQRDGEFAKHWPGEVIHMKGARPERYSFSKEDLPMDFQEMLNRGRSADVRAHVEEQVKLQKA